METMKSTSAKPLFSKMADVLLKTQEEVDDLAVQFALGKAEAADAFEEIKQTAKSKFQDLRNSLILSVGEKRVHALRTHLDDLEVQFALGKADSLDFYEEQRKNITKALHDVETELKVSEEFAQVKNFYVAEIEKLKLKMDVLKKQFDAKNINAGGLFKEKMQEARQAIDALLLKAENRWDGAKEKYEDFTDEVREASKHVKKAIDVL